MTNSKMPLLFIGHGSPMNAILDNDYTKSLATLTTKIPQPKSILMISAHWTTRGTWLTRMERPKTIHDFQGFPSALSEIQYPAAGDPKLVDHIIVTLKDSGLGVDDSEWGLDHGTWSVLRHIYPKANIPVVQLSLDLTKPNLFHFELGAKLKFLREEGVLIMGSGNIVHNLRTIKWEAEAKPYSWAMEFDLWVKKNLEARNFQPLIDEISKSEAARLSIPTLEHYLPLLYILGASEPDDELSFDYEGVQNASISMRSLRFH